MRKNWLFFLAVGSIVFMIVFILVFLRVEAFISVVIASVLGSIAIYYNEYSKGNLPTPPGSTSGRL